MKDKLIQIRADAEFLSKLEYLQTINGFKNTSETIRKIVEKEWRKETVPKVKMCKSCKHFSKLTYDDSELEIDWCYEPSSEGAVAPWYRCEKYEFKEDLVNAVRCKNCKHNPKYTQNSMYGVCPFTCEDDYYSGTPDDDFYCAYGEEEINET